MKCASAWFGSAFNAASNAVLRFGELVRVPQTDAGAVHRVGAAAAGRRELSSAAFVEAAAARSIFFCCVYRTAIALYASG